MVVELVELGLDRGGGGEGARDRIGGGEGAGGTGRS